MRPTLAQLEQTAQKIDHRRLGNWMARRVSRPLALRITWVVLPWGLSAHTATLLAWGTALGGAAALAWGTAVGLALGAVLLQLWYLLDHVDGQLARARGTASLDGVQLDYLMHHTIALVVPLGLGWGCWSRSAEPAWLLAGLGWGLGGLVLGLVNDTRHKAFVQRLKLIRGELRVVGGGGGRPAPASRMPSTPLGKIGWLGRKSLEPHVVVNVLSLLAVAVAIVDEGGWQAVELAVVAWAVVAPTLAIWTVGRAVRAGAAEQEFAAWFQPPSNGDVVFRDGWWVVEERMADTTPATTASSAPATGSS
jgi:hypothetical protein